MSVILLLLGIVVVAAGVTMIGFGIPINESTPRTTLIIAGTTALTGGLTLIGLSAVLAELRRVAKGLRAWPAARSAARLRDRTRLPKQAGATNPYPPVRAPVAPASARSGKGKTDLVAVYAGRIHTVGNGTITDGVVLIEKGRVKHVGPRNGFEPCRRWSRTLTRCSCGPMLGFRRRSRRRRSPS